MSDLSATTELTGSTPAPEDFKDRSTGLVAFGILTILLGIFAGLLAFFMLFAMVANTQMGTSAPPLFGIVMGVAVYVIAAVVLVWLGIGSIMARRWARALMLIASWSWLGMGLLCMVMWALILPQSMARAAAQASGPQISMLPILVFVFALLGVFFVIAPAVWIFFYSSRHVKATCEKRDPVSRWTDFCPLPVLGTCLWLALGVPMMLMMPFIGHGTIPFFGMFISGIPGGLLYLALTGLWALSAWLLYRLERLGWWIIFIALCAFTLSGVITYARHDIWEMYQLMGYTSEQTDQIRKMGIFTGNNIEWMTLAYVLPMGAWLLYIRRFLARKA